MVAVLSENFRNKGLEIYEPHPCYFLTAPGLVWPGALKKTEVNLELLTDIDILLKGEKSVRCWICYAIHQYVKVNNKNHHTLSIGIWIICMDG